MADFIHRTTRFTAIAEIQNGRLASYVVRQFPFSVIVIHKKSDERIAISGRFHVSHKQMFKIDVENVK
jgi:hypothetical protein